MHTVVPVDLSQYTLAQLLDIQARLPRELDKRRASELTAARREVEEIARGLGMSLEELLAAPISGKVGTRPPMYRHPDDHTITWSGSGRTPRWFNTLIEGGMTAEQLLIDRNAKG